MKKTNIAIVGVGMMGGSLGLSIKKKKAPYHVVGIGRKIARLQKAKRAGICDEVTTDLARGVQNADIIVLCTPVNEIAPFVKKILPHLKNGAVITDIGSVKSPIFQDVKRLLNSSLFTVNCSLSFVGSHPMCGSEKTGFEVAEKNLYEDAVVVLSPVIPAEAGIHSSLKKIEKFWKSVGAQTIVMDAKKHDLLVAQISHLPHLLSSALAQFAFQSQKKSPELPKLIAGSFRDMTRVADSDPDQWAQISSMNQKSLLESLTGYQKVLNRLISEIKKSPKNEAVWKIFFSSAKTGRQKLLSGSKKFS